MVLAMSIALSIDNSMSNVLITKTPNKKCQSQEKSHADFADEADKTICRNRQNLHEIVFLRVSEDR